MTPTPDQLASFKTIADILVRLGEAPVATIIIVIILAPWIILIFVSIAQHRRFESVVRMYENNFSQVEGIRELAEGYRETLMWATSETTATKNAVVNNMHCPIVRGKAKPRDLTDE